MTIPTPRDVIIDALIDDKYKDDTGLSPEQRRAQDGCREILRKWNEEYANSALKGLTDAGYSIIRTSVLETLTIPRLPAAAVQRAQTTADMIADDMYAQQGFH